MLYNHIFPSLNYSLAYCFYGSIFWGRGGGHPLIKKKKKKERLLRQSIQSLLCLKAELELFKFRKGHRKEKKCTHTCINLQAQWLPCCWSGDARGLFVHWAVSLEEGSFLHPRWEDTQRGTSRIQEQSTVIFTFLSVPDRANSKIIIPAVWGWIELGRIQKIIGRSRAHVTRHCYISHLFGARNKIFMEWWIRLKEMCGSGFVFYCARTKDCIPCPCHWGGWQQWAQGQTGLWLLNLLLSQGADNNISALKFTGKKNNNISEGCYSYSFHFYLLEILPHDTLCLLLLLISQEKGGWGWGSGR